MKVIFCEFDDNAFVYRNWHTSNWSIKYYTRFYGILTFHFIHTSMCTKHKGNVYHYWERDILVTICITHSPTPAHCLSINICSLFAWHSSNLEIFLLRRLIDQLVILLWWQRYVWNDARIKLNKILDLRIRTIVFENV